MLAYVFLKIQIRDTSTNSHSQGLGCFFQLEGKWVTTAIAADNVDKIEEEGPLRIYVRELTCSEACSQMGVTFYVK